MTFDPSTLAIIDADTHIVEHADLWTSRAPASLKDRVPRVEDVDGEETWIMDGNVLGRAYRGGVIRADGAKIETDIAYSEWRLEDIHAGSYDLKARLAVMDAAGITAQVAFPNNLGLGGQGVASASSDRVLLDACIEMYNDYGAEVQEESGNRVLPMAVMPAWDVDACVREARRAHSLGLRGVNITSDPSDQGAPDLADHVWDPLWSTCVELALPVHFHIGNSDTTMSFYDTYSWGSNPDSLKWAISGMMLFIGNARSIVNIIGSGMLERHPELQIVSVESGVGWIPFVMEALLYEMAENAPRDLAKLSLTPLEYFQRQIYATTWFERSDIANVVERLGADRIMFETDYPHPTCLYPDPLKNAAENLATLSESDQEKILSGNAKRLYKLG
ncbi:MAG: amidohydrolase family protein [Acidimicrobiales bacterium]